MKDSIGFFKYQYIPASNRYDLALGLSNRQTQEIFTDKFTKLPRLDYIVNDKNFNFLNTLKAPKGWSYLYFIYNRKTGLVKLGRSRSIWKRVLAHVAGFTTYANADIKDLGCVFSRNPLPDFSNAEQQFLDMYREKSNCLSSIKKEFFFLEDPRSSMKLVLKFLENLEENI